MRSIEASVIPKNPPRTVAFTVTMPKSTSGTTEEPMVDVDEAWKNFARSYQEMSGDF